MYNTKVVVNSDIKKVVVYCFFNCSKMLFYYALINLTFLRDGIFAFVKLTVLHAPNNPRKLVFSFYRKIGIL